MGIKLMRIKKLLKDYILAVKQPLFWSVIIIFILVGIMSGYDVLISFLVSFISVMFIVIFAVTCSWLEDEEKKDI